MDSLECVEGINVRVKTEGTLLPETFSPEYDGDDRIQFKTGISLYLNKESSFYKILSSEYMLVHFLLNRWRSNLASRSPILEHDSTKSVCEDDNDKTVTTAGC